MSADESPQPVRPVRQVYAAIGHVMADMARSGVGKNQTNSQQNFRYRGVDDVMDALAPSLSKHGLIIVPHVMERTVTERASRAGGTLFHTLLRVDYDFISVGDGSAQHVGPIYGEAMDAGDKATNKAMATAFKYACVQTFCIPISGDDPDAATHDVAAEVPANEARREPERMPTPAPLPPREIPSGSDGKPRVLRPGGNFGYGKKYYDTPWQVMTSRDLEWFRLAERTPPHIRERIEIEQAWRAYEASQLDAGRAEQRAADDHAILNDDIP